MQRALEASARVASDARSLLEVRHTCGAEAVRVAYVEMLNGRTPPHIGVMLSVA